MTQPIECVLAYSRKGLIRKGKDWVTDEERSKALPAKPVYVPVRGPYGEVARVAYQANALQERAGFIDFLFAPEPVLAEKVWPCHFCGEPIRRRENPPLGTAFYAHVNANAPCDIPARGPDEKEE